MGKETENGTTGYCYWKQTGKVAIRMTNDYLFRALLQTDNETLKHLIADVLHLPPNEVVTADILNPIELGRDIDAKEFILDVKVDLNHNTTLNLELQVVNYHNWPERSLSYLCRSFDNLSAGQNYIDVTPVIQIDFLDFTLFEEHPEFCSSYYFMNPKTGQIYTDKLQLHVVQLPQVRLATEEDIAHHVNDWARMFKAATWEELRMIAKYNPAVEHAIDSESALLQDFIIRDAARRREEYYIHERATQQKLAEQAAAIQEQATAIQEKDEIIRQLQEKIQSMTQ